MEFIIGAIIIVALAIMAYLFFTLRRDVLDDIDNLYHVTAQITKILGSLGDEDELTAAYARIDEIDDKLTKRMDDIDKLFKDYDVDEQIDIEKKMNKAFTDGVLNVLNYGLDKGKKGE